MRKFTEITQVELKSASEQVGSALSDFRRNEIGSNSDWFGSYVQAKKNNFCRQVALIEKLALQFSSDCVSIADFGAAPFVTAKALTYSQRPNRIVTALDIDPFRFENIKNIGVKLQQCDLDDVNSLAKLNDSAFDIVFLSHIFEHLRIDLLGTLNGVYRAMAPGGLLYVETPNVLSLMGWYRIFLKRTMYGCAGSVVHEWNKLKTHGHMGHVREYTSTELCQLLVFSGFEIVSVEHCGLLEPKTVFHRVARAAQRAFPSLKNNVAVIARREN
ncbi:MAG: methyltransferase domain-containing protein [Pseudomonadota bacterium]|nr:methyltransferase domain-containing protein [Pseudomonadota bacterium]